MKPATVLVFIIGLSFSSCESCIVSEDRPDLFWSDYQYIQNPCTGQIEYLNVSHFFWVYNLNNPNYPPIVWLYYRENEGTFHDCLGLKWVILSGSRMTSNRYMANKSGGRVANSPTAQAFITVKDPSGMETKSVGDVKTFPDLEPGNAIVVETTIEIGENGSTYLTELTADPIESIEESDEFNNGLSDGFSRTEAAKAFTFRIQLPSEQELSKIKTKYVVYDKGQIEVRN